MLPLSLLALSLKAKETVYSLPRVEKSVVALSLAVLLKPTLTREEVTIAEKRVHLMLPLAVRNAVALSLVALFQERWQLEFETSVGITRKS
jgi:hypothetical protein